MPRLVAVRPVVRLAFALLAALVFSPDLSNARAAEGAAEGRLLRFPDIHRDVVVFVYGGDIWRASASGGPAQRLTAHPGLELFPKISEDGQWIAYSAEYTGSRQIYVMPITGGSPRQLTFYNDVGPMPPRGGWDNWVLDWTRDGKILARMNRTPYGDRMGRYFLVDPAGGLEAPLPLPHGGSASYDPEGRLFAYAPVDREFRTWKNTRGGRAQDIWIYDFAANRSERVTSEPSDDSFPMWFPGEILFASDRNDTVNLFGYDTKTKAVTARTKFDEWDVLWPSKGPGAIVFMRAGQLWKMSVPGYDAQPIPITLGAEMPYTLPAFKSVSGNIQGASLSPSGARVVIEARGELFSVPAKDGPTRSLSATQGVRERSPSWSPDGKEIAYLSDATGEYELYVRNQDGSGTPRQLTKGSKAWLYDPVWSPDGKKFAIADRSLRLSIIDVASGAIEEVDRGTQADLNTFAWSPDSKWLVYEKDHPSMLTGLALYSLEAKQRYQLGDGMTNDHDAVFSADGKQLFFLSERDFNLVTSAFEFDYLFNEATKVFAVALEAEGPALFPPKSDEEKPKDEAKPDEPKKDETKKAEEKKPAEKKPEPLKLDVAGFIGRTIALPGVPAGNYRGLSAVEGFVYYVRVDGDTPTLFRFDLKERKEEKVLDRIGAYELTRDGKKILFSIAGGWNIADARPGLTPDVGKLDLSGLRIKLDPRKEWQQIFDDGYRIMRDWFYDPAMHGFDWAKLRAKYQTLVPFVAHRADLDFVLGEMISELEAGHTYVASGDEPRVERIPGGMLGCEMAADPSGRYRLTKIFQGENWDPAWRGPLSEPGVNVKVGQFLLAIDGVELTTKDHPYRLLEDKANKQVVLTIGDKPELTGARTVTVRPVASEANLRYIDWVRERQALVEKLSGGKIGYIHMPNTAFEGQRMLQKMFFGQTRKAGLIVDDRYNGGGFIPVRSIEYLSRKTMSLWQRRNVTPMRSPAFAHDGPKAMLMNGYSSSGGDALPYWFKKAGLGPLIGTRTWGGLIGLSGNAGFVDGGSLNVPTFRIYDTEGRWVIENEGVSPDIEVIDLPERLIAGGDPSIERAVEVLLAAIAKSPPGDPKPPVPPNLSGR